MSAARIYLDHNATTRVDARVRAKMLIALDDGWGNASSIHAEGRRARDLVERARKQVGRLVGGTPAGVIFTSGGTEADVLAVVGGARAAQAEGRPARVVSSPLEHPAVRGALAQLGTRGVLAQLAGQGFEVVLVPVDADGRIEVAAVRTALAGGAALVSFALANHELGNVYDVAALAAEAHAAGAVVHCDAVQAAGKIPIDVEKLAVDYLSISAHKIGGPKGVGALWVRPGAPLAPVMVGGHQERGQRGGTENVIGVVGMGEAAEIAAGEGLADMRRVAVLRERLEAGVRALGARVNGDAGAWVGNTLNCAWDQVSGELLVIALDLEGVAASTGAACTSGSVDPSPVLLALGQPRAQAAEGVRFSLGRENSEADVDRVLALLPRLIERIRNAGAEL